MATLLVGLGGIGTRVVGLVKRKMLNDAVASGRINTDVAFVAFDTTGAPDSPDIDPVAEFFSLAGFDASTYVAQQLQDRTFQRWWPNSAYRPPGAIVNGAGAVRTVGRLAIHHEIAGHLGSLGGVIASLSAVGVADGALAQIDVYICAILSNGTGAGSFIDMAYLLKDQIRRAGAVPSVVGVFVDASVVAHFNRSQKKKEQSLLNGYAALRELEFWMKASQPFLFDYNNHSLIADPTFNPTSSVFDYCFLIQPQNEQGKSLPDFNDYIDVTAEGLFHLVGSSVRHLAGPRWLDGITAIISSSRYNGMSTSYASLGVAQLSFPIEQVTDYCAYEMGEEIIALLTTPPTEPQKFKQEHVLNLLFLNQLQEQGKDQIFKQLEEEWREIDSMIAAFEEQFLSQTQEETWDNRIQRANQDFDNLYEQFKKDVAAKAGGLQNNSIAIFDNKINDLLNEGRFGEAAFWVETMLAELEANKEYVEETDLPGIQQARNFQKEESDRKDEIADAYDAFWPFGKGEKVKQRKIEFLSFWKERAEFRRNEVCVPAVIGLYDVLIAYLKRWDEAFDYTNEYILNPVRKNCERKSASLLLSSIEMGERRQNRYIFNIPIGASRAVVDQLYSRLKEEGNRLESASKTVSSSDLKSGLTTVRARYEAGDEGLRELNDDRTKRSFEERLNAAVYQVGRRMFGPEINRITIEQALTQEVRAELEAFWQAEEEGTQEEKGNAFAHLSKVFGANTATRIRNLNKNMPPGQEERIRQEQVEQAISARVDQIASLAVPLWKFDTAGIRPVRYLLIGLSDTANPNLYRLLGGHPRFEGFQSIQEPHRMLIWNGAGAVPLHKMPVYSNASSYYKRHGHEQMPPIHTDLRYMPLEGDWAADLFPTPEAERMSRIACFCIAEEFNLILSNEALKNYQLGENLLSYSKGHLLGTLRNEAVEKVLNDESLYNDIHQQATKKLEEKESQQDVLKTLEFLEQICDELKTARGEHTAQPEEEVYDEQVKAMTRFIEDYEAQPQHEDRLTYLRAQRNSGVEE